MLCRMHWNWLSSWVLFRGNTICNLFGVIALYCYLIKSHGPLIRKRYIILLTPHFVDNFREITDINLCSHFLFSPVAKHISWVGQLPSPHGSQFSYCDSFGHLHSARKYLMTSDKAIHSFQFVLWGGKRWVFSSAYKTCSY